MPNLQDRDLRQREIVPPERLRSHSVSIIGVGAIGRQVALQLAAVGAPRMRLVDPDTVEVANLAAQGYLEEDLDRLKVDATADMCRRINGGIELELEPHRFRRSMPTGDAVFCCVDSIATRKHIWDAVHNRVALFVDGRMSAEVIRIVTAADDAGRQHYPTTLFAQEEALAGSCTAKSTIYTASIAAGLMLGQFTKWLRGISVDADVSLNLLAGELAVADVP